MAIGSAGGEIEEWVIPDDILFLSREEALVAPVEYIEENSRIHSGGKAPIGRSCHIAISSIIITVD